MRQFSGINLRDERFELQEWDLISSGSFENCQLHAGPSIQHLRLTGLHCDDACSFFYGGAQVSVAEWAELLKAGRPNQDIQILDVMHGRTYVTDSLFG